MTSSILPIPREDLKKLPEGLRNMLLAYVQPLNKSIEVLLSSRNDEFEHNLQNVINVYMKYQTAMVYDIRKPELEFLLQKSFGGPSPSPHSHPLAQQQHVVQAGQTTVERTLNNTLAIITKATRLMVEPVVQHHIRNHSSEWDKYRELLAYPITLNYIIEARKTRSDIEQSVVDKILQRCKETTHNVEAFVDTLKIDTYRP